MVRTPPLNPASRLLAVIRKAMAEPGQQLTFETWRKVLQVEPDDPAGLFVAYARLLSLGVEARDRVAQLPDIEHGLYLHGINRILGTLGGMNFHVQWQQHLSNFDDGTLRTLEIAADQIKRGGNEIEIEQPILDSLRSEIEALIAETLDSDLDKDIRRVVIEKLEELRRAILNYQLDGAEGLRRAMEGAIGAIVTHPELAAKAKTGGVAGKFMRLIVGIDVTTRAVLGLAELAAPILQRLLPPGTIEHLHLGDFPNLPGGGESLG